MSKWKYLFIAFILPWTYICIEEGFSLVLGLSLPYLPIKLENINNFMLDSLLCLVLLIFYSFFLYPIYKKRGPRRVLTKKERSKQVLVYLVICLGVGGLALVWFDLVDFLDQHNLAGIFSASLDSFAETSSDIENAPYLWSFLSVVLLGPIVEELLFRGLQYHYLSKFKGGWFPIFFSALSFGLFHAEPIQVVYTFFMGLGFALIYQDSQSLLACILIHIFNNFLTSLPPVWNLENLYPFIDNLSLLALVPSLFLAYKLYLKNQTPSLQPWP